MKSLAKIVLSKLCLPNLISIYCYCLIAKSCMPLCDPVDCSTPGFPVFYYLLEFAQTHVHRVSDASSHLILCHPLLILPSIFPSIRVFFNELALHIRWPKYWSFSFSISPSNEYLRLISFRIDCLDLLAIQGTLKSLLLRSSLVVLLSTTVQGHQFFDSQPFLLPSSHIHTRVIV